MITPKQAQQNILDYEAKQLKALEQFKPKIIETAFKLIMEYSLKGYHYVSIDDIIYVFGKYTRGIGELSGKGIREHLEDVLTKQGYLIKDGAIHLME